MAKKAEQQVRERVIKKTSQGGSRPKTAGMDFLKGLFELKPITGRLLK